MHRLGGAAKMHKIQTELESTLESVDTAETLVVDAASQAGLEEEERAQLGMAVRECMVNAVVHGNRYNKKKHVHFLVEVNQSRMTITIGDEGSGFDLSSLPDPTAPENLLRQSGRGLLLMRAFVDSFDLHPRPGGGTEVVLTKNFGA